MAASSVSAALLGAWVTGIGALIVPVVVVVLASRYVHSVVAVLLAVGAAAALMLLCVCLSARVDRGRGIASTWRTAGLSMPAAVCCLCMIMLLAVDAAGLSGWIMAPFLLSLVGSAIWGTMSVDLRA